MTPPPNAEVRLIANPDRRGRTTGRTKKWGTRLLVEVQFGAADKEWIIADVLEVVEAGDDIDTLLARHRFTDAVGLRRLLTYHKLQSALTTLFYSMGASNTDFYAHQFKPVLKFVESADGRILIADEVGLGKTIEAVYIWRELQARIGASRLLIVCPAKLQDKWASDLRRCFEVEAQLCKANDVLESARRAASGGRAPCQQIASLESLRPPRSESTGARSQLAALLEEHRSDQERALFDLVVIDEAHYLRNTETTNHRLGRLLAEASRHLVLLSATPIQTAEENLYSLLSLLDPDRFQRHQLPVLIEQHRAFVLAQRALWIEPPQLDVAKSALDKCIAEGSGGGSDDPQLAWLRVRLESPAPLSASDRVDACRALENASPLGSHLTRSMKRHVLQNRVVRSAQTRDVVQSDLERQVYDRLSSAILAHAFAQGRGTVAHLILVGRQRQLSSSLVAALRAWKNSGLLQEIIDYELLPADMDLEVRAEDESNDSAQEITDALAYGSTVLEDLVRCDSKYDSLMQCIAELRRENPGERVIVFAFFRATLAYLRERLTQDGIETCLIQGGMSREDREAELQRFRQDAGPSVLLSSEVGAEGIDLQFCRVVVNYDLPWNPMRVEQRIGRVDRLGQESERISVVSLFSSSTLEDQIVSRLYNRLGVFERSIGDIEEVLGDRVQDLILQALDPRLSPSEREALLLRNELALANEIANQREVEEGAASLTGFFDYILGVVEESRERGRWIDGNELREFVEEYLLQRWSQSEVARLEKVPAGLRIQLPEPARQSLARYVSGAAGRESTRLRSAGAGPVDLCFDPKASGASMPRAVEKVTFSHPIVGWICSDYQAQPRFCHPTAAVRLASSDKFESGVYFFYVGHWKIEALKRESKMAFRAIELTHGRALDDAEAELLVHAAAREGMSLLAGDELPPAELLGTTLDECRGLMDEDFGRRLDTMSAENLSAVNQLIAGALRSFERRESDLLSKIAYAEVRLHDLGNPGDLQKAKNRIAGYKGRLTSERERKDQRVAGLEAQRELRLAGFRELAAGVIVVGC